ncbi:NifU family protein [Conexibacter sp. CPCC 206217]|uniref:NifU family protein n=1 Tax=Conexibacter sp. CPCC 206217 TaxID=3064574 RepID=UPI0027164115|nr:NifU family protein [Conexibacter sp. CPCC 206217]MDO8210305.1 NifU family protein [Conexibacter sp. CPCC 206217]
MAVSTGTEQALVERVQELTEQLEQIGDPFARDCADQLATAIVQLYGEGLERIFAALSEPGIGVEELRERLVGDGVVASLLLIHDLYPVDLDTRVREALDTVLPYLESHGGGIELLGIEDGVARLRLRGSCDGCAASAATLEAAVEQALQEAAPDLRGIDVEGAVAAPAPGAGTGPAAGARPARPPVGAPQWVPLDGATTIARGTIAAITSELLIANVAGTLLAYRNACAGCGENLDGGMLIGGTLTCAACGRAYDLPRAGRGPDGLQLEPIPLLRSDGVVKVAFAP